MANSQQPNVPKKFHLSQNHHMTIPWKSFTLDESVPAKEAGDRKSVV